MVREGLEKGQRQRGCSGTNGPREGGAFAILQGVVVSGQKFNLAFDGRVVVAHFVDILEGLVVGENPELVQPEVAAYILDAPYDGSSFQVQGDPVALGWQGGTADVDDWLGVAVGLLLF